MATPERDQEPRPAPQTERKSTQIGPAPLIGRILCERYQIDGVVAEGGMSTVYRGQHVHMLNRVALKILRADHEHMPELLGRFRREAVAVAHIKHANVAGATDFGRLDDGSYFLALEYVPGTSLRSILSRGRLPLSRAVVIARQIAAGLGAAHVRGVVHRDIKPNNIMVVEQEHDLVKIIDFGLSRVRVAELAGTSSEGENERELTASGVVFGTVAYLAPEASLGMGSVDARSDLYALGIILYEMLAGKRPFEADEPAALFQMQMNAPPAPPSTLTGSSDIPPEVEAVVMRLLEKAPEARYQSAAEVIAALDAAMAAQTGSAGRWAAVPKWARGVELRDSPLTLGKWTTTRWTAVAWVLGLAVVIGIAGAIASALRSAPATADSAAAPPVPDRTAAQADAPAAAVAASTYVAGVPAPGFSGGPVAAGDGVSNEVGLRAALVTAAKGRDPEAIADAVKKLAALDSNALADREVRSALRGAATTLADAGGDGVDRLYDALLQAGEPGLDAVYDIARSRSGTKAGRRASDFLRQQDVAAHESPALRVALQLRDASCGAKPALFPRAAELGDERALAELEYLQRADCPRYNDPCCFQKSRALASAIQSLRQKVRAQ
jgi:serine/threonine-protein kinase